MALDLSISPLGLGLATLAALVALIVVAALAFRAGAQITRRDERAAALAERVVSVATAERDLLTVLGAAINEALLIAGADNRVRYANAVARTWFNIGPEVGSGFDARSDRRPNLKSILRSAEMHDLLESLPAGSPSGTSDPDSDGPIEHTLTLRDHVYRVRLQRMADGGAMISLRDDTEVERLARARRDLVANISHDLRTPLTSIRLLIEPLLDAGSNSGSGAASAPEIQLKRITGIRDQAAILERLADGLVQLNRLETGRALLQLTAHPLAEVVATAVQAVEPQFAERGMTVATDIPDDLSVLVDEPQIIRVLTNLLDNALQASRPGRCVLVGVAPDPASIVAPSIEDGAPGASLASDSTQTQNQTQAGGGTVASDPAYVEVFIRDEGHGISPDDAERIFERFFRGDRARTSSGTGLGLAIARHIVEGHGGRIWLDRSQREGACFRFTVPLAE